MSTGTAVRMAAEGLAEEMARLDRNINDMLAGRRVRITSDYNGQPYGSSRPSLRGKEYCVRAAFFSGEGGYRPEITLWLDGPDHLTNAVRLDEVEVL